MQLRRVKEKKHVSKKIVLQFLKRISHREKKLEEFLEAFFNIIYLFTIYYIIYYKLNLNSIEEHRQSHIRFYLVIIIHSKALDTNPFFKLKLKKDKFYIFT